MVVLDTHPVPKPSVETRVHLLVPSVGGLRSSLAAFEHLGSLRMAVVFTVIVEFFVTSMGNCKHNVSSLPYSVSINAP